MAKKILLVDISHLFFRAFYAFPRNLQDSQKNPINAIFGVAQMILSVIEKEKPDYIFGGKDLASKTLRSEKMPEYKGGRPELDPDLHQQIPRIFDFFNALSLPIFHHEGYEADDILASLSEKFRGNESFIIEILTGDADAFQLIGENIKVLKPSKGENIPYCREVLFKKKGFYPEEVVDFKAISGDPSDNLKGIAGIGEKGATKLIREYGTLEKIFKALDEGKIKGSLSKKLLEGRKEAFFIKEIATLHRDLPLLEFNLEAGNIKNFSVSTALQFFETELGSKSLQTRIKTILSNSSLETFSKKKQESLF